MNSFLHQLTRELYDRHGRNLSDCWMVFPNRRAGIFFSKYLNEVVDKPLFSPRILTITELVGELSSLMIEDNLSLLFRLYKKYNQKLKTKETFDDFYHWGEMLLSDFNDIDKNRVNAQLLFENLASVKKVEDMFEYLSDEQVEAIRSFWSSFNPKQISGHQKDFIAVWEVLYAIFSEFKNDLKSEGLAYEGMAYRDVVDKLERDEINIDAKLIFVGFNALNNCEKDIFKYFKKQNIAEFYWDYDTFYLDNPNHEAGMFVRENLKLFPSPETKINFSNFKQKNNPVEFIAVSSEVGQAKFAHKIIEDLFNQPDIEPENTAIVLADENILLPVLHSIPKNVKDINITMGCSAQNTPVAALLHLIVELQKGGCEINNQFHFYHKNVLALLNHQYLKSVSSLKINELAHSILTANRIYIKPADLQHIPLISKIFLHVKSVESLAEYLLELLQDVFKLIDERQTEKSMADCIEQEYIYHMFLSVKRLNSLINEQNINLKIDTYYRLLDKMAKSLKIPFEGEPLAGLQIMGILETRLLDFKKIIILSVNEGKLPKIEMANSFIPYNLRKGFGMPTIDHQDAIYAYYFYRLIQRADEIKLLYSTKSDNIRTGEMSRFLYQLKYESGFNIIEKNIGYDISLPEQKSIQIKKNNRIQNKLMQYCEKDKRYFSPSALNTYLKCSLRFYFKYIAGLKEPEEITEEIDPLTFGNLFHDTIEQLYLPYKEQTITNDTLNKIASDKELIDRCLTQSFKTSYFKTDVSHSIEISGRNILIYDVLKKYINQLLKTDKKFTPFKILGLEQKYSISIPIKNNGQSFDVNISGSIDRIDTVGDNVRIIDYKTGKANTQFTNIVALFEKDGKNRNDAAFQTFVYCLLYDNNSNAEKIITPGIYSLKEIFNDTFNCRLEQKEGRGKGTEIEDYKVFKNDFVDELKKLLEDIFNPSIPFSQTEDEKTCGNCPYVEICHRD